jgi:ParB family chromosome partitioning protein
VIRDSSDAETMEIALIENLQRKDLSPFEEADGLRVLAEKYGYTHENMAEKIGKSRSTITESLSLTAMPEEVRQLCRLADIQSKSVLLQIVRQNDPEKMVGLIEKLQQQGTTRVEARKLSKPDAKRGRGRPKNYVFKFQPRGKEFSLALQFRKGDVEREEIIRTLEAILESLRMAR